VVALTNTENRQTTRTVELGLYSAAVYFLDICKVRTKLTVKQSMSQIDFTRWAA